MYTRIKGVRGLVPARSTLPHSSPSQGLRKLPSRTLGHEDVPKRAQYTVPAARNSALCFLQGTGSSRTHMRKTKQGKRQRESHEQAYSKAAIRGGEAPMHTAGRACIDTRRLSARLPEVAESLPYWHRFATVYYSSAKAATCRVLEQQFLRLLSAFTTAFHIAYR